MTKGKMIVRLIVLLLINFGALAIGGLFTSQGVPSDWYENLNKAPWTPPGWVFGFAWTSIMICFSLYLAFLWPDLKSKKQLLFLFSIQWVLNVSWNPVFFYYHHILGGMIVISSLTILIGYLLHLYQSELKYKSVLLLPYFIWLLIATSLNGYILINN